MKMSTVAAPMRLAIRISSSRSRMRSSNDTPLGGYHLSPLAGRGPLPAKAGRGELLRRAARLALELLDRFLADAGGHVGVERLQRLAPGRLLLGGELDELRPARFLDLGQRLVVLGVRYLDRVRGRLGHRLVEL